MCRRPFTIGSLYNRRDFYIIINTIIIIVNLKGNYRNIKVKRFFDFREIFDISLNETVDILRYEQSVHKLNLLIEVSPTFLFRK